jgi:hypothetical protein
MLYFCLHPYPSICSRFPVQTQTLFSSSQEEGEAEMLRFHFGKRREREKVLLGDKMRSRVKVMKWNSGRNESGP